MPRPFAGDLPTLPARHPIHRRPSEIVVIAQSIVLQNDPGTNFIWPLVFSALIGGHQHALNRPAGRIANAKLRLAHDEIERLAKAVRQRRADRPARPATTCSAILSA